MTKKTWMRVLIALLLTTIIVLISLPFVAKKIIINNSEEWIGRQVDIDKIRVNYFTGTLRIIDFKMLEEDKQNVFVSFDTLLIDIEPHRLFINDVVLDKIYLKGLKANVSLEDSTFNFDDLIAFHQSDSNEESTKIVEEEKESIHYMVSNIELNDANFSFDDRNIDKVTNINDLSFFIPFIGWNQEDASEAGLRFAFKNEGYFESIFHLDQNTGVFDADITINHLYLDAFQEYVMEYATINSLHGVFSTHINIDGNINYPEKSVISSQIEVLDFELKDEKDKKFLGASKIKLDLQKIDYINNSFIIDSLLLLKPYVYIEIKDSTNNFFEIFNIEPSDTSKSNSEITDDSIKQDTLPDLYYALNHFDITEGIIDYRDALTGDPFDYHLSQLMVSTDSITSSSKWISVNSTMLLNERGKLIAELGANPSDISNLDLNLSIEDFLLSDLNIYTDFYVGHTIIEGDMFYYSDSKIRNGNIESENKLLIKNTSLKSSKNGLVALPLKFAFFLLKDKNGDINLDIPVRGDLKDPSVSVGKIVWNTFKNLIIKAAASPGKLLAGIVDGEPKDLEKIEFSYLDTSLTEKHRKQLDLLLDLEKKKEGIEISLEYLNDQNLQKRKIAEIEAGKIYFAETNIDFKKNKAGFEAFLINKTSIDSLDYNRDCMLLATPTLVDSLMIIFNDYRFSAINIYLQNQSETTTITLDHSSTDAPENTGSEPVFKINYSMSENEGGN